jgi:hypothetical protein
LRDVLLRAPLGYAPMNELDDLVWSKNNKPAPTLEDKTRMPANEPAVDLLTKSEADTAKAV